MKPKHKMVVLIAVAALTMAALIYVNLQKVRDTGPRGVSSVSNTKTPEAGQRSNKLDRTDRVES
ncbi:hypothetical protein ACIBLA_15025 [Streptomyces sp. NPDC050433]|uniref:hypothetical protein n=1 Tax=Streptomyces sp. NPDC050433 TaxID=3365615 RepID=UPI0037A8EC06